MSSISIYSDEYGLEHIQRSPNIFIQAVEAFNLRGKVIDWLITMHVSIEVGLK
jgi:hypothetical protein